MSMSSAVVVVFSLLGIDDYSCNELSIDQLLIVEDCQKHDQ
jgi:hypothetical protein